MYNPFEHFRLVIHRAKNAEKRDRYAQKIRQARRAISVFGITDIPVESSMSLMTNILQCNTPCMLAVK